MAGICFTTFRSRRPEPPPAAACNCAVLVATPLAPTIKLTVGLESTSGFLHWYRNTGKGCCSGNVRFSVPTGIRNGESHFRRLFCLLFWSRNRRSSRKPSGLASPSSSPFGSAKPACTALTGSVGCTNGRGARRNRAAYRGQRPFADFGEAARGSHRQTVGKKVSAPPA